MPAFHIHLRGQVQGVGFRPLVYRLAKQFKLPGEVSNGADGLHVFFLAAREEAQRFYARILASAPPQARILDHSMKESDRPFVFQGFNIVESRPAGVRSTLPAPDVGICSECRQELRDPADRRFQYPFNTCTTCGPRYSITESLPYDRERTAMSSFRMCQSCRDEYEDPDQRRFYSQTNSCPACAVELSYWSAAVPGAETSAVRFLKKSTDPGLCLALATEDLAAGKIIAMKGVGGYLLLCDAANAAAVTRLRERKCRPTKPFAVLYPDLKMLCRDAVVGTAAASAFLSEACPVVLCRQRPKSGIAQEQIAPGLDRIGAMRPDTPLAELLLSRWQKPVVATSGNLSGSPLFFEDGPAMERLAPLADSFLLHNRRILIPQDDSVLQFSPEYRQRIILRRSKGLAPTLIHPGFRDRGKTVLAMGADVKSSFALQHAGTTYVSQYLGDLGNYDAQLNYDKTLFHLLRLLEADLAQVVTDQHPGYFSKKKGEELARRLSAGAPAIPLLSVQHHQAHFAAVLAENGLLYGQEPVLGVIWDGAGWGDDGQIWGGEFFIFKNCQFERVAHLDYFPQVLGDRMTLEPRLSALSLCHDLPAVKSRLSRLFSEADWRFLQSKKLWQQPLRFTSSVGRLFDGVAALLGLQAVSTFEGEAALRLERLAGQENFRAGHLPYSLPLKRRSLFTEMTADLEAGISPAVIAFRFHLTLVHWVEQQAVCQGVSRLAFSGGVFQNALLTDLLLWHLGRNFDLYFHRELAPNDECISYGQLALAFAAE